MKKFFAYIKKKIKFLLIAFISLIIILSLGYLYYQNIQDKKELKQRLDRLEAVNDSLKLSPQDHYSRAVFLVEQKKYNEALKTLNSVQARYPNWNTKKVNSAIKKIEGIVYSMDSKNSDLVSFMQNMESVEYSDTSKVFTNIDNPTQVTQQTIQQGPPQVAFKKFEYENKKFPLQASTKSSSPPQLHVLNRETSFNTNTNENNVTGNNIQLNTTVENGKSNSTQGFQQYDFEDTRYKKNIQPSIRSNAKISDPNKSKNTLKENEPIRITLGKDSIKSFQNYDFEDDRYKKNIQPSVRSNAKITDPTKVKNSVKNNEKKK